CAGLAEERMDRPARAWRGARPGPGERARAACRALLRRAARGRQGFARRGEKPPPCRACARLPLRRRAAVRLAREGRLCSGRGRAFGSAGAGAYRLRALYSLLWVALLPLTLLRLWWRGRREPGYREHVGERFGRYHGAAALRPLWIHAVSVGEVRAAAPFVQA